MCGCVCAHDCNVCNNRTSPLRDMPPLGMMSSTWTLFLSTCIQSTLHLFTFLYKTTSDSFDKCNARLHVWNAVPYSRGNTVYQRLLKFTLQDPHHACESAFLSAFGIGGLHNIKTVTRLLTSPLFI